MKPSQDEFAKAVEEELRKMEDNPLLAKEIVKSNYEVLQSTVDKLKLALPPHIAPLLIGPTYIIGLWLMADGDMAQVRNLDNARKLRQQMEKH